MQSKSELWDLFQSHYAEAEFSRKHVQTKQFHATMALLYYQMWSNQPTEFRF